MATRYAALLRGINVGRGNRLAMADWRALLERDGFTRVSTLLASGNAVFDAPAKQKAESIARKIEASLAEEQGISTRATVLSAKDLAAIAAESPLADGASDPSRYLVCVAAAKPDFAKLKALAKRDWGQERFVAQKLAAFLWVPKGIAESAVFAELQRALGKACTTRNWATWQKLIALAES